MSINPSNEAAAEVSAPPENREPLIALLPKGMRMRMEFAERRARGLARTHGNVGDACEFLQKLANAGWGENATSQLLQMTREAHYHSHWKNILPLYGQLKAQLGMSNVAASWAVSQHTGLLQFDPRSVISYVKNKTRSREQDALNEALASATRGLHRLADQAVGKAVGKKKGTKPKPPAPEYLGIPDYIVVLQEHKTPQEVLISSLQHHQWSVVDAVTYADAFPIPDDVNPWSVSCTISTLQKHIFGITPTLFIQELKEAADQWMHLQSLLKSVHGWALSPIYNSPPSVEPNESDRQDFYLKIHQMHASSVSGWYEERHQFTDHNNRNDKRFFLRNLPLLAIYEESVSAIVDQEISKKPSSLISAVSVIAGNLLTDRELALRALFIKHKSSVIKVEQRRKVIKAMTEISRAGFYTVMHDLIAA